MPFLIDRKRISVYQALLLQMSGVSALDDKTSTVQYKPATNLAGNDALAHFEHSRGYDQYHLHHPIFMAYTV